MRELALLGGFLVCWAMIAYIAIKEPFGDDRKGEYRAIKLITSYLTLTAIITLCELLIQLTGGLWLGAFFTLLILTICGGLAALYWIALVPEARRRWQIQERHQRYIYGYEAAEL